MAFMIVSFVSSQTYQRSEAIYNGFLPLNFSDYQ